MKEIYRLDFTQEAFEGKFCDFSDFYAKSEYMEIYMGHSAGPDKNTIVSIDKLICNSFKEPTNIGDKIR